LRPLNMVKAHGATNKMPATPTATIASANMNPCPACGPLRAGVAIFLPAGLSGSRQECRRSCRLVDVILQSITRDKGCESAGAIQVAGLPIQADGDLLQVGGVARSDRWGTDRERALIAQPLAIGGIRIVATHEVGRDES